MTDTTDSGPVGEKHRIEYTLHAPRPRVWAAFTDPDALVHWWGPEGFTTPRCEIDPRPGGKLRIDMRGPDGQLYPMAGTYREVVEPERLVMINTPIDDDGRALFEVEQTVTLIDRGDTTDLVLDLVVVSATEAAPQYLKGMDEGWTQSLTRLDRHVAAG